MNIFSENIIKRHTSNNQVDKAQIEVIFSPETRLSIEAPAGYGKTITMISKIAYLLGSNQLNYPKKILALTFSINAAFKIRNELRYQLPTLLQIPIIRYQDIQSVHATNYHGLCRKILGNYGYLLADELKKVSSLKGIGINVYDDISYTRQKINKNFLKIGIPFSNNELEFLINYIASIKNASLEDHRNECTKYLLQNMEQFLNIVKSKFLPHGYIPFDAILLFTIQLFQKYPSIRSFYNAFFPVVFVDEFQDTNILQWCLLQDIVGEDDDRNNHLYLFGDRHQKIYEFIGALDGIITEAKSRYDLKEISLQTNHRFINVPQLLAFDENIRKIVNNHENPLIKNDAIINVKRCKNQTEEANSIIAQVNKLLTENPNCTVAILTRAGKENTNTIHIINCLNNQVNGGFSYFFALYSDEDQEYIDFHRESLHSLYQNLTKCQNFTQLKKNIINDLKKNQPSETWTSLLMLLETFFMQLGKEFRYYNFEQKVELIVDTLKNNALKQYLMYIASAQVTLTTIHGAKGLEWDYVILPDMEKSSFPSYPALCKVCLYQQECQPNWALLFQNKNDEFNKSFNQEINVFYVGGTRAKKAVYFTYSLEGFNTSGNIRKNLRSCFLGLEGLKITDY